MTDYTTIEELMRIKEEMEELIGQAREILGGTQYYGQADAYWLSHIEGALGNGTFSMCSMRDTIQEIEGCSCSECNGELKDSYCEVCER